jgi:hypothetical protein
MGNKKISFAQATFRRLRRLKSEWSCSKSLLRVLCGVLWIVVFKSAQVNAMNSEGRSPVLFEAGPSPGTLWGQNILLPKML